MNQYLQVSDNKNQH